MNIIEYIAKNLGLSLTSVKATLKLIEEGGTIPFIARYRKEMTGSLDEVQIGQIRDLKISLNDLQKRRKSILGSLQERSLLSASLEQKLNQAKSLTELEDLYLPHKPKKRTRAQIAREKGLQELAVELMKQGGSRIDIRRFINRAKEINSLDDALDGARDIIAEKISEDSRIRQILRRHFIEHSSIQSKVIKSKQEEAIKFRDYFDHSEKLKYIPSHRLLAILRGVNEKYLRLSIKPDESKSIRAVEKLYVKGHGFASNQVSLAAQDSYKRLLAPSLENEVLKEARNKADQEAVKVFTQNFKELLMSPPLGLKSVLAFDPGFRTGAKVAVIDKFGKMQEYCNLFPFDKKQEAAAKTKALCQKYNVGAIAVGNGTAGRETETFLRELNLQIDIVMVDESGASIYSASEVARKEFPDLDLTVRGAISIGRRLQDPLAELVKVEPKSIGVGQYQHDVDQTLLKQGLDDQVMSCVNAVGVNLNTASSQLLSYVAGLGPKLAENIINYRNLNGSFKNRKDLKKVPRLGEKAYEQAAGFLRIYGGNNILDQSAVHPESYHCVKRIGKQLGLDDKALIGQNLKAQINVNDYSEIGKITLVDILDELEKPGRDPRKEFQVFSFAEDIHKVEDLYPGIKLPGIVTNVTKFGAFVDIGVHQDGLVHISKLTNGYVSDPSEVIRVRQQVEVTVLEVDLKRKRIALSMID